MELPYLSISKFNKVTDIHGAVTEVNEELTRIQNGYYQNIVEEARKFFISDKTTNNEIKRRLPAVTFSGVFDHGRKAEKITTYTSLIVLDIDHLAPQELKNLKGKLSNDRHVIAIWCSPSGFGLKFLIFSDNADVQYHKLVFDFAARYFADTYNVAIDQSGSDPSRLCFSSYDPDLIINKIFEPFHLLIEPDKWIKKEVVRMKQPTLRQEGQTLFNNQENDKRDKETMVNIIKFLKREKQSITADHESWYKVALAMANTFTFKLGYQYYMELCRLDKVYHDHEKSENMLEYAYRNRRDKAINFATIIYLASKKGFELPTTPLKKGVKK